MRWLRTFGIDTDLIIPNAIDADAFRASSSGRDFRAELGIDAGTKLVAFVGRLEPEKGAVRLANALGTLGDAYAGVFAGEGRLRGAIEDLCLRNVHLVGRLSHSDVSALFSQADVFCLPTRSEGFGLGILEASAWGVPVAVPDVGIARAALGDDFVELVPPFGDLAERIAEAASLDASRARARIEESFSWHASAQALRAAFARTVIH